MNPIKSLLKKIRRANRAQWFAFSYTCSFCKDNAHYKYTAGEHITYLCDKCCDLFGFDSVPGLERLS